MKRRNFIVIVSLFFSSMYLTNPATASTNDNKYDRDEGAVFTMTNAADGNEVIMFERAQDGSLLPGKSFSTGGLGSGGGLGNQAALVLSKNHRWLFVVNPGSDEVSVFAIRQNRLVLRDKIHSGGIRPISVTFDRGLLYVLNDGSDSISGFTMNRHGKLQPLDGSTRSLSGTGTGSAQIQFDPDGEVLVVTEKATNLIDTFVLDEHGLPGDVQSFASVGQTPFGFSFDKRGHLIVSEAVGGAPDASSVSSYIVTDNGNISVISGAVATTETAACWIVVTRNGRYAYTTNAGSSSVSGYTVARNGSLTLLDADGRTGDTGAGTAPIDMALSNDSRYLYTLSASDSSITAFQVGSDGSLTDIQRVNIPSARVNGLAAY